MGNFGLVIVGCANYALFVEKVYTTWNVFCLGLGYGIYFLGQNVSHYILAIKYRDIARIMPDKLAGKPEKPVPQWERYGKVLMLFLNIALPLCSGLGSYLIRTNELIKSKKTGWFVNYGNRAAWNAVGIQQILQGSILVWSVFMIRKFLKDKGAYRYVDKSVLRRSMYSFSLFLFSNVLFSLSLAVYSFFPTDERLFAIFMTCTMIEQVLTPIAELLLCKIIIDLSVNNHKHNSIGAEDEIFEANYKAELDTNIWNSMVRLKEAYFEAP